jgi:hypothetical protein
MNNPERSRHFVKTLAFEIRGLYEDDPSVRVFSQGLRENRKVFKLNELLYDVHVCQSRKVSHPRGDIRLEYVTRSLIQIESEFARDRRQALIDFSKLVTGAAAVKVFIGPITKRDPDASVSLGNVVPLRTPSL